MLRLSNECVIAAGLGTSRALTVRAVVPVGSIFVLTAQGSVSGGVLLRRRTIPPDDDP